MSINRATIMGNVGDNPKIANTTNGSKTATFSLATSEKWTDKKTGEKKEKTEWHRIVVFGDALVSIVENYVKKGSKLYVEGQLQTRKWTDSSGIEKYMTEIVVKGFSGMIQFCESKNADKDSQAKIYATTDSNDEDYDDEIPF